MNRLSLLEYLRTGKTWGERRGSNPRHLGPQPSALPAELRPPCAVQGLTLPPIGRSLAP